MFAGHDNTATALCYTLGFITENPDINRKCIAEIARVCGTTTRPTMDHLREMNYLEACIKEALRIRPPTFEWFRAHSTGEYLNIKKKKYYIEPSSSIFNVTHFIQMDPAHFNEPEKFRPERFLGEQKRHPFSFIPFSAGTRNCIGQKFAMMELKIVLSMLLRTFKFAPKQVQLSATI